MSDVTLTTADAAGFIPQYWANRALDVLRAQIVLAQLAAKDINFGEVGWRGKSITVPYPGRFSAVDKAANTPITPQVPVGGQSITLTLNKHKVVPFLVEDFAEAQTQMDSLFDRYLQPATVALCEQFEQDLWNTADSMGIVSPIGTPGTDMTSGVVRTALAALDNAKAPSNDRYLVISPKDRAALLGDATIQNFLAFSQPQSVTKGYFAELYGLDVYWSQFAPSAASGAGYRETINATGGTFTLTFNAQTTSAIAWNATPAVVQAAVAALTSVGTGNVAVTGVPATATTTGVYSIVFQNAIVGTGVLTTSGTSLTGGAGTAVVAGATKALAFQKNALMYAVRPFAPIPANSGVYSAQAMDAESGLSLRLSMQYDINNAGMRGNLDILYGSVVLRADQAILIDT